MKPYIEINQYIVECYEFQPKQFQDELEMFYDAVNEMHGYFDDIKNDFFDKFDMIGDFELIN